MKKKIKRHALEQAKALYEENEKSLEEYISRLLKWNEKINLISRNVSRETVREHVVHSLLPTTLHLLKNHRKWIDSGTGGGLPGIPLAICEPEMHWYLNDNVNKKIKVVGDIIQSLHLQNAETIPESISLVNLQKGTGIITKHAFKITGLLRLLGTKPWKTILMWKGVDDAEKEITESGKKLNCTIYEFNFGKNEPFYDGKGLVLIER